MSDSPQPTDGHDWRDPAEFTASDRFNRRCHRCGVAWKAWSGGRCPNAPAPVGGSPA